MTHYSSPKVYTLGSVQELTTQVNKLGLSADGLTGQTQGQAVGVPFPAIPCIPIPNGPTC